VEWLQRFEIAMRALPDQQRQASLLPLLHDYQKPSLPKVFSAGARSLAPTDRFRAAVQEAKISPDKDIPHVAPEVIVKYVPDLRLLGLL
jgi:fatty acid CoA ligase FadD9